MMEPVGVGDVIADKYQVDRILGRGGMGLVVAATHRELRKVHAIKLMLPEANAVPKAIERFFREARAASELTSEHVAHVFDVGRLEDGTPFIVMEHLEGRDLANELAERVALPVEEAVLYAIQVCEALADAHAHGIVHRDLKPGNLFLTSANDGSPCIKVLDFGISKLVDPDKAAIDGKKTTSGAVLGSPLYMSPEQIRADRDLDARCDIWGLGVILYQLTTGCLPFDCGSVVQSLAMILERSPPPPSERAPGLPKALDAVILRCLEKRHANRYADVGELARDLLPFAPPSTAPLVERVGRVIAGNPRSKPAASPRGSDVSGCASTIAVSPQKPPGAPVPGIATATGVVAPPAAPDGQRSSLPMLTGVLGIACITGLTFALLGSPQPPAPAAPAGLPVLIEASAITSAGAAVAASVMTPMSATAAPSQPPKPPRAPPKRWSSAPPRY